MSLKADVLENLHHESGGPNDLADLIDLIGRSDLDRKLFDYLRSISGCEHVSAFYFPNGGSPKSVLAEGGEATPQARHCAQKYVDLFWRLDPVLPCSKAVPNGKLLFAQTSATDVANSKYKNECYTNVGVSKRLSINNFRENDRISLNLYRREDDEFSESSLNHLREISRFIFAILRRHMWKEPASVTAPPDSEEYARMLKERAPGLTDREREVCVQVLRGLTSEGIALTLGISINTVLTYRKRAYSRLCIGSQNELMRLVAFGPQLAA